MRSLDAVGVPVSLQRLRSRGLTVLPSVTELSAATTVTANASTHTKGSWTELVAATTSETTWVSVAVSGIAVSATDTSTLLDIGIGGAGSEVAIASDLAVGFAVSGTSAGIGFSFPLRIPRGARVSARTQAAVSADTASVSITLMHAPGFVAPLAVDAIGTSTVSSSATQVAGTSYVQITAATAQAYRMLVLVPSAPATGSFTATGPTLTLGVGASAAEVAVARALAGYSSSENLTTPPASVLGGFATGHFPAGSRLAVASSAAGNHHGAFVIGVPYA